MHSVSEICAADKPTLYRELCAALESLIGGEIDLIANFANAAALLYHSLPELNWAGFYFLKPSPEANELVVGPFQGKPACVRIPLGKGVCGAAAERRTTIIVQDVNAFSGHIACDA